MTLEELERLEREATPWPWSAIPFSGGVTNGVHRFAHCNIKHFPNVANAALIAAARNALPVLLRIARAARALPMCDPELGTLHWDGCACTEHTDMACTCGADEMLVALAAFESGPSKWAP